MALSTPQDSTMYATCRGGRSRQTLSPLPVLSPRGTGDASRSEPPSVPPTDSTSRDPQYRSQGSESLVVRATRRAVRDASRCASPTEWKTRNTEDETQRRELRMFSRRCRTRKWDCLIPDREREDEEWGLPLATVVSEL